MRKIWRSALQGSESAYLMDIATSSICIFVLEGIDCQVALFAEYTSLLEWTSIYYPLLAMK